MTGAQSVPVAMSVASTRKSLVNFTALNQQTSFSRSRAQATGTDCAPVAKTYQ